MYSVLCIVYSRVVIGVRSPYLYSTGFYCLFQPTIPHHTNLVNYYFQHIPQFHPVGFEKMKIPKDLYARSDCASQVKSFHNFPLRILNNRKKQLNAGNKWEIERCDFGMQNCQKVLESQNAQVREGSI